MDQAEESDKMLPISADTDASADSAFEPTIDELVNDFDDEQTLREEEALAAIENPSNNPLDEIEALREESEMPLEELLAKYALPGPAFPEEGEPRRKKKKSSSAQKKQNKIKIKSSKSNDESEAEKLSTTLTSESVEEVNKSPAEPINGESTDCILIESGDEAMTEETTDTNTETVDDDKVDETLPEEKLDANVATGSNSQEKIKIRRSHLFDLYPEQNFDDAIAAAHGGAITLETLYSEEEEEEEIEEEEETDPDYVKKTIMVGSAFQAVIPGLSQYGDVLPYENEDKLVWEPSQVSEPEVEEYLLKIREIKPTLKDEETKSIGATEKNEADNGSNDVDINVTPSSQNISDQNNEQQKVQKENTNLNTLTSYTDTGGVVKDNEQALHLLVQCGYDFKEALRRKRLNAVPLTGGTMSLWSEEECQKFEEGIQKFGKDFLKIRQNQVRTRTMRELVQFYYLWKKSERRDHNFANADTVDHMDIYLNEGEDYSTSPGSVPLTAASAIAPCRKLNGCNQNNFSIMTGSQTGTSPTKVNNCNVGNKKRTLSDSNINNIQSSGNVKNNVSNNSDQISTVPLQNTATIQPK